ncbi:MAG: SGNH/GDSL hydrolase family protein [Pseudomonadota bacterium]
MARKWIRILSWSAVVLVLLVTALLVHLYLEGRPAQGRPQYVAMGSSFAAGPAISEAAADSPWFCARSRDNYAQQLARLRGLSLVDVSCGGATSRHLLDGGQWMQPAQIAAVTPDTELVTITIGGNDIAYIGQLMARACGDSTPWLQRRLGGCKLRSVAQMQQGLVGLQQQLLAVIAELRRRAPQARIVLLTYQSVLPESGSCERLALGTAQADEMRGIASQLAETTRAAAAQGGASVMDASRLTQGHDACADEPWMNGMYPAGGLLGAPLHPTIEGMTAIAQALDRLLNADTP